MTHKIHPVIQTTKMLHAFFTVKTHIFESRGILTIPDLRLMEAYSQMRTDFVLQEKWPLHASGVDQDDYDLRISSYYILASHAGRVVAGLRMTKVASLEESLSYNMWQFACDHDAIENSAGYMRGVMNQYEGHNIWDITRLITEAVIFSTRDRYEKSFSRIGLFKILASATTVDADKDCVWVFTTTAKMYRFMQRSGFNADVLAHGRISAQDKEESYLCALRPHHVFAELRRTHPALYGLGMQTVHKVNKNG